MTLKPADVSIPRLYQGLLGYEPIFRAYLRELFRLLIADGVSYVETRINFLDATMVAEDGSPLGHVHWLKIYDEVVEQTKKEAQESGEEFWGAKVWSDSSRCSLWEVYIH